jgi:hypothetical protein
MKSPLRFLKPQSDLPIDIVQPLLHHAAKSLLSDRLLIPRHANPKPCQQTDGEQYDQDHQNQGATFHPDDQPAETGKTTIITVE